MIKKVLIANRGEIAVRIIRACREMGIETVAVYSEADKEALHTQLADEAICIGPAPSSESYLSMDRIISATIVSGADAIHPGFGFLSENSKFAELCEQCHITFIGPGSKVIARLGNKQEARNTMIAAGVPVIPGSKEPIYDPQAGAIEADRIGYPVIVKAALGGGGLRNAPLGHAAAPQVDALPQEETDLPLPVVQGEDVGVEVVLVAVAHEDQQGLLPPQGRQRPLPPVKEQGDGGQLHQKAAVGKIRNAHGNDSPSPASAGQNWKRGAPGKCCQAARKALPAAGSCGTIIT